jgi:hypothetical protein
MDAVAMGNGSDSEMTVWCKAFRVGTAAGAVQVTTVKGTTLIIPGVQIGETVRLQCKTIWATNTTAQGITAFTY